MLEAIQTLDIKKWLKNQIFPPKLSTKTRTYLVNILLSSIDDGIDLPVFKVN